ncbi:MAG TPA: glycerophosphodiester phosphodiesterase family protein [Bacilli bacterium]|nr:glycerophosphodiester phosphodiesterase family protein [Bacilli bacterium]
MKSYQKLLIAHACGLYNGMSYVNSVEAFYESYKQGFRRFEVDLYFTKDEQLISYHSVTGYNFYPAEYFEKINMDLILSALGEISLVTNSYFLLPSSERIMADYQTRGLTPMTAETMALLCKKYPDVEFVLDTKSTRYDIYAKQYQIIKDAFIKADSDFSRVIPQFYNINMAKRSIKEFEFSNSIYTLYKKPFIERLILRELKECPGITGVTLYKNRLIHHKDFLKKLHKMGIECNIHTIGTAEEIEMFKKLGVDGIYSHVSPKEMQLKRK